MGEVEISAGGQLKAAAPPGGSPVENLRASSATTAVAVAEAALDGVAATAKPDNLVQAVQDAMWQAVRSCPSPRIACASYSRRQPGSDVLREICSSSRALNLA